jgi:hypothetical protein
MLLERAGRWSVLSLLGGRASMLTPADAHYISELRQQIADVRAWAAEVEGRLDRLEAAGKPDKGSTMTVDDEVAAADRATRVQKALEREFGYDRRTIRTMAERLVKAHGAERQVPNWATSTEFWKYLAQRNATGATRLAAGIAALEVAGK